VGNLRVITNRDVDFYHLLGRFLSRREIVKEIGAPIWDDDDKTWVVYLDYENVIGFCGLKPGRIGPVYVIPSRRNEFVGTTLLKEALHNLGGKVYIITNRATIPFYKKFGFVVLSTTKNFAKMELDNGK